MWDLAALAVLLIVGYGFGRLAEKRHYRSIMTREDELRDVLTFTAKYPPLSVPVNDTDLVVGSVVISVDYFKRFVASLRNIIGGRMMSYETLLDRGRREAMLRMKEAARARGAGLIYNVKFETASISKGRHGAIGSVEVFAYGTALKT